MSTIDSFSFISAFTIGKNLIPLIIHNKEENSILYYTKCGLGITAVLSIFLAILFEHAIDIWYMVGSFTVPTLFIPLIAGLYNIKIKKSLLFMMLPMCISITWYILGFICTITEAPIQILVTLDPMYPGIFTSLILFLININPQRHRKAP